MTGKKDDHNFEPRLLLLDPTEMNRRRSQQGTDEMLEIGQEGQGQLMLELRKKNSWYGPNESAITVQDPLRDILDPK